MRKNLTPRAILVIGIIAVSAFFLLPNLMGKEEIHLGPSKLDSINLGLDLKGGMHVVLRVLVQKAITDEMTNDSKRLPEALKEKNAAPTDVKVEGGSIIVTFESEPAKDQAEVFLKNNWTRYAVKGESPTSLAMTIQPQEMEFLKQNALQQAKDTIANRVDEFAVKEPEIYTQGQDQIVVRLPGVVDPARAKKLIGRTALLEFKIVESAAHFATSREALLARTNGEVPPNYEVYPSGDASKTHTGFYLMKKVAEITGKELVDARRTVDEYQRPAVSFEFNSSAAKTFAEITGSNIDKMLAIVLDNKVMSAPTIRARIYAHGVITGDFTDEEAQDLAIVLRAGSLPVPVEIEEERTVGPTLGEDSIRKGYMSFLLGSVLVVIFMVVYYRAAGLIANLALVANMIIIMGCLALFGATLTLPGIAGIILTIGMAVDANVIINERIRDELRVGKSPRAAVSAGYDKALWAILDSNITTAIAGVFLYQFGTGPIRGFAVTLMIGLASTVFTAVVMTHLVYDWWLQRNRDLKTLSI